MRRVLALLALLTFPILARAQPTALGPVDVARVATLPEGVVGIAYDPVQNALYALTGGGDLYRVELTGGADPVRVATAADHGAPAPTFGIATDAQGTIFLVGSRRTERTNTGVVRRGRAAPAGRVWETVAETAPYPYGRTAFDHSLSAVAVHPDGTWLALNSGSRTDHGEVQDGGGTYPGVREVPLTSAIFRVPADATDLVLPDDEASLVAAGYLFADGTRNSFGLAFDADGELFGAENSGDRDDGEELNWLRPGRHYGFPWRMGTNDTPQQFPGYDPASDPLVNPASTAYQSGAFANDPAYPPPPPGITFTDPLRNVGPDADEFRRPDGSIADASASGVASTTFTPHRSPLGLVFRQGAGPADCDAFMLSWTDGEDGSGSLLAPFADTGEDLVCLDVNDSRTEVASARLVTGFHNPIAGVLVGSTLFVAEFGAPFGLWAVTRRGVAAAGEPAPEALEVTVGPNPFRRSGALVLTTAEPRDALVRLVDTRGRILSTLLDGPLAAGTTRLTLAGDRLAAGTYAVVVEAGGAPIVRTFTVVR